MFLKLKAGNLLAALPGRHTEDILGLIADVYPGMEAAKNVIQTSLQNANPVIHPAVSLANSARIEGEGDFLFYEEGVTPGVGRLIEAVDLQVYFPVGRGSVVRAVDGVSFQVGSVYELEMPAGSFDAVLAHAVLYHLARPVAALMAATTAGVDEIVGGSPRPLAP